MSGWATAPRPIQGRGRQPAPRSQAVKLFDSPSGRYHQKFEPIVRVTVLNGFLAYVFYAGALLLDLGRPWNVINPIIGNAFGLSSVLFLVAWHFLLYMICEFLEFSPVVAQWLNWPRARRILETGIVDLAAKEVNESFLKSLWWCVGEMERRYKLMSKLGVRSRIQAVVAARRLGLLR